MAELRVPCIVLRSNARLVEPDVHRVRGLKSTSTLVSRSPTPRCLPTVRDAGGVMGRTDDTPVTVHHARFPVAEQPTMGDVDFSPRTRWITQNGDGHHRIEGVLPT